MILGLAAGEVEDGGLAGWLAQMIAPAPVAGGKRD